MRRPFRFRLRTMVVAIAVVSLILAYADSYRRISHRGLREAADYGLDGFAYVPIREWTRTHDLSRHSLLAAFYAPANVVDRLFFGGKAPAALIGIMWRLSG